jgi:hypothetical protein
MSTVAEAIDVMAKLDLEAEYAESGWKPRPIRVALGILS